MTDQLDAAVEALINILDALPSVEQDDGLETRTLLCAALRPHWPRGVVDREAFAEALYVAFSVGSGSAPSWGKDLDFTELGLGDFRVYWRAFAERVIASDVVRAVPARTQILKAMFEVVGDPKTDQTYWPRKADAVARLLKGEGSG